MDKITDTQILFMETMNKIHKSPMNISIINSLKELKSIKEKQIKNNMKLETIVKVTSDGDIKIPSDMKVGSDLINMVKELRENGWRTFEHHDNWIKNEHYPNPTFEQQFDTGKAYDEMLKTKN